MPTRPQPWCSGKNRQCRNRAAKKGLCADCYAERQRDYEKNRPSAYERGYDDTWRPFAIKFLIEHPYCECDDHKDRPDWQRPLSTDVDHIDGLGPLGPRGYDKTNLRALAHACHSRRTAADQAGGWNRRATPDDDPPPF